MTKERAIDLCKAIDIYLCTGNPIWDVEEIHDAMSMAIEALQENESLAKSVNDAAELIHKLQKKNEWIPCSERLPIEEEKSYWVCTNTGYQCQCRWTDDAWGIGKGEWRFKPFDIPQYSKVVAWMPLPEPYNAGSEDKE